jgi:hypothetical protein
MKKLIFSMALAIISSVTYSQTSVTVFNDTHLGANPAEELTIGASSCTQPAPCVPADSGSDTVDAATSTTIWFGSGYIIQLVGASGMTGSGFSFNPAISYGGCGTDAPGPYFFEWVDSHTVRVTNG